MAITKIPAAGFTGNNFRNIIINGDMSIAQRGTSTSKCWLLQVILILVLIDF
jgi:hypothetical protein